MEQLKDLLAEAPFTDTNRVIEILHNEAIDDLDTLRAASEDDLRKVGLKMGDIIKIRMLLAKQNPDFESSLSSMSQEVTRNLNDKILSKTIKKTDENAQGFTDGYSYSAKDMLQKCFARTKCTKAQIFFRNLLRDCARKSEIWQTAYPIQSIPDVNLNKFFELVFATAPQLAGYKAEIRRRLGQALQNRRKYENDIEAGKRKRKNRNNTNEVVIKKTIVGHLQKQPSVREDVIVFKEKQNKNKLAKATHLGPKDSKDKDGNFND